MAVLGSTRRASIRHRISERLSRDFEPTSLTKADLQVLVNYFDDLMEANGASINANMPQPAKSALTPKQKAEVLAAVILDRYEVL